MMTKEQQELAQQYRKQATALDAVSGELKKMADAIEQGSAAPKPPAPKIDTRTADQKAQTAKISQPPPPDIKGWAS
jgi:hypothetical protein